MLMWPFKRKRKSPTMSVQSRISEAHDMFVSYTDNVLLRRKSCGYPAPSSLWLAYFVYFVCTFVRLGLSSQEEKAKIYVLQSQSVASPWSVTSEEALQLLRHFEAFLQYSLRKGLSGYRSLEFYIYAVEREVFSNITDDLSEEQEDCLNLTLRAFEDELLMIRDTVNTLQKTPPEDNG